MDNICIYLHESFKKAVGFINFLDKVGGTGIPYMFTVHVHMHTMYVHIVFVDKTGYPKLLACKTWQETLKKTSPSECAATTPACLTVTVV